MDVVGMLAEMRQSRFQQFKVILARWKGAGIGGKLFPKFTD